MNYDFIGGHKSEKKNQIKNVYFVEEINLKIQNYSRYIMDFRY